MKASRRCPPTMSEHAGTSQWPVRATSCRTERDFSGKTSTSPFISRMLSKPADRWRETIHPGPRRWRPSSHGVPQALLLADRRRRNGLHQVDSAAASVSPDLQRTAHGPIARSATARHRMRIRPTDVVTDPSPDNSSKDTIRRDRNRSQYRQSRKERLPTWIMHLYWDRKTLPSFLHRAGPVVADGVAHPITVVPLAQLPLDASQIGYRDGGSGGSPAGLGCAGSGLGGSPGLGSGDGSGCGPGGGFVGGIGRGARGPASDRELDLPVAWAAVVEVVVPLPSFLP